MDPALVALVHADCVAGDRNEAFEKRVLTLLEYALWSHVFLRHVTNFVVCRKLETTHIAHLKGKWENMQKCLTIDQGVSGALLNYMGPFWKKNATVDDDDDAVVVCAVLSRLQLCIM